MSGGVSLGFGLVTDENIDVGKDLVNLGLEELRNERSGKVHGEGLQRGEGDRASADCDYSIQSRRGRETDLVLLSSLLGEDESALESVSEEESTEVVALGLFDEFLDLGPLEVRRREGFSSTEFSAEGSVEIPNESQVSLCLRFHGRK